MSTFRDDYHGWNASRHLRYFEAICRAKGASEGRARVWAWRQVKRGRRAPTEARNNG
jgi:hypothetical protein